MAPNLTAPEERENNPAGRLSFCTSIGPSAAAKLLFLSHINSHVVPADFFLSCPAAFTDSNSARVLVRFLNLLFLDCGHHSNNSDGGLNSPKKTKQNKKKTGEASLSPATSGRRPSADRERHSIKKATSVGDSSRGTLEEFFSPFFCSTKLTLGLLRDQRAQRALSLAVHSGWSPSCRKGQYKECVFPQCKLISFWFLFWWHFGRKSFFQQNFYWIHLMVPHDIESKRNQRRPSGRSSDMHNNINQ